MSLKVDSKVASAPSNLPVYSVYGSPIPVKRPEYFQRIVLYISPFFFFLVTLHSSEVDYLFGYHRSRVLELAFGAGHFQVPLEASDDRVKSSSFVSPSDLRLGLL